jgi:hypothetical protein
MEALAAKRTGRWPGNCREDPEGADRRKCPVPGWFPVLIVALLFGTMVEPALRGGSTIIVRGD